MRARASTIRSGAPARISFSPRDLPPLPTRMVELLQIANDPSVSFAHLDRAISGDQALTLRVLAVANSSFYGCSRRVDSVRTAITLLGTQQVQNIASAMALAPAFDSEYGPGLWAHGLATALWTRKVMTILGIAGIDYVFTAALMHDIGIVLLLRNAPDEERRCLELASAGEAALCELETKVVGCDHALLGSKASEAWRLPKRITGLVAGHHRGEPADAVGHAVLALADALAAHTGSPAVGDGVNDPWPRGVIEAAGISPEDLETLLAAKHEVHAEAGTFG